MSKVHGYALTEIANAPCNFLPRRRRKQKLRDENFSEWKLEDNYRHHSLS